MAVIQNKRIMRYLLMMVVSLLLVLNFSIGVSASISYDRQEADACITISQRLSVKGGSNSPISLKQALKNLDKSGVRPGQTEIHTSQLNNVINEIQNNYNPSKAYSSIYSDGANRYIVEGHHTTVAFEMLGKDSAINMNTATSDLPSSTNIYWSKKWYQFWRKTIKVVED